MCRKRGEKGNIFPLYKIIMHNYIHNSSLRQIPSLRPVVRCIRSGFHLNSLNCAIKRKHTEGHKSGGGGKSDEAGAGELE